MRLKNLVQKDIFFQWKYGFYYIYALISIIYICVLNSLPEAYKNDVSTVLVFSDPAAIGLFFMGAIILLEKSQRILNAVAISPVKVMEYIFSKVIALAIISSIVSVVIAISTGMSNILLVIIGTVLTSIIFTLIGIIAATQIQSLNQFMFISLIIEIICFLPPIVNIFSDKFQFLKFFPLDAATRIIGGTSANLILDIMLLIIINIVLFILCNRFTEKMFYKIGGGDI
nr:ABC transporter permease [uncultured Blautia sp.]